MCFFLTKLIELSLMSDFKFVHENNLRSKIAENYNNKRQEITDFLIEKYEPLHKNMIDACTSSSMDFEHITELINDYLNELDAFGNANGIKSQSKFRSTFLEEISTYLFMNVPDIAKDKIGIFNKGVYAGMQIGSNLEVTVLKKDVDFCIGKKVDLSIDGKKYNIILPLIAVEVKTYLDATMFGEVQFSSKAIKSATPNARTYVLMETNQVGKEKIIAARYDNNLTEMFVLRKDTDVPIKAAVLEDYYNEIVEAINEIGLSTSIDVPGRLIKVNDLED